MSINAGKVKAGDEISIWTKVDAPPETVIADVDRVYPLPDNCFYCTVNGKKVVINEEKMGRMSKEIQETNKKLFFIDEFGNAPIEVELSLGWIRITQKVGVGGFLGHKPIYKTLSFTSGDAIKLKECIERLVK